MSNIGNYNSITNVENDIRYAKVSNNTKRVQMFARYLHDFLPVLEQEFDSLEALSKARPNEVFPIKMQALSDIYKAAEPLYEWYVQKAKRQA